MSLELTQLAKRPGAGKLGKPTNIRTNFFEVTSIPTQNIHHYDIVFDPPETPLPVIRKIWKQFEESDGQGTFKGIKPVFDGRKNLFSPKALPLGEEQVKSIAVADKHQIRIKKVGEINMSELSQFLTGKSAFTPNCLTAIMVLDVLIRYLPSSLYTTVGRSIYVPNDKRVLPNGAEVWQGYYQSARAVIGKMMINIDLSATAFYESGPVPEVITKMLGRRSIDEFRRGITDRDMQKLEKFVKRLQIYITHRGERRVRFKVTGITRTPASNTEFKDESGNMITVAEYFLKQYKCRLVHPFLPCLIVKKDIFFPMEVCEIVPGIRMNTKLNEKQTSEMIKYTCQKPNVRANKINQGLNLLKHADNSYMQQFDMSVKPEMAVIKARVLPIPKISYHPSSQEAEFAPPNGIWNLRGKKVAQGATLGSWSVVNFAGAVPAPAIQRFIRELCQTFLDTGLNVVNRQPPTITADPQGNVERTLKEAWLKAGNASKANPQLIVCILPNTGVPLYATIKRISDTIIGIPTQCLQSKHVSEAKKQYCANVCLKVNLKLGGMNLFLSPTYIPFISKRPTIVIGADVTHPAPGDMNRPSIAAISASMDARASRYSSAIRIQANRTEIIADLPNMIKEVLKNFYQSCGQKPERILFYRDGVSEGQFKIIMDSELAGIKAACASLDKNYKPTITFVVVQKRHHARFFPMSERDSDRTGNCLAGTVVDTDIVHPFEFDFYLQSHAGLQGTSRSTHYHVLYDENKFTSDSLQELTYNLCYIYGRATRSVSLVPPAYYADLIATRARFHRKGDVWSDSEATSELQEAEAVIASFAVVKPELQKVMYFM